MSKFTTKTELTFEPGVSGIDLATTGENFTSNADFAPRLGDLAHIPYRRGRLKYKLNFSSNPTSGSVDLVIKAGGLERDRVTVPIGGAGASKIGAADIDLSAIAGESAITVTVDVTTAAQAGVTAELYAIAEVSVPLIVSSC